MSEKNINKSIIFNCHFNGLSIIQSLGRLVIPCVAMDCKRSIGTFSKYGKYIKCPDPLIEENNFINFLYNYCKKQNLKPVLFPTNDHWAVAISRNKKLLKEVSYPCVSDYDAVNLVINKNKFYKFGMKKKYSTPKSWIFNDALDISNDNYPLLIKPVFRRISSSEKNMKHISRKLDDFRFTIINNKHEMNTFLSKEKEFLSHLLIQEYISGKSDRMYTVGVYANKKSEIFGLFTGRKLRGYPSDYGDCIVGQSQQLPKKVLNEVEQIVKDIRYSGIAEFEYKKDNKTGEYRLIEINPRSWSWIGITPACNVNLPYIAYMDLTGKKVKYNESTAKDGEIKYVKLLSDMKNCLYLYKYDYPLWHMNFREWKKSLSAKKIVYAEFALDDPMISIHAIKNQFVNTIHRFIKHS